MKEFGNSTITFRGIPKLHPELSYSGYLKQRRLDLL
jgi:hypothetical protein